MAGTSWVRLDVGYFRNAKVRGAGVDAALLHLAAICYLGEQGKGSGILPADALDIIAAEVRIRKPEPVVTRLVKYGLWHDTDGDWIVHDYAITNGDDSEAARARERSRRYRAAKTAKRMRRLDEGEA